MTPRPRTAVAVGVLLRDDGSVLLADRPAGKPYAGYWEFPGGKIESGESVTQALARELREELGVEIDTPAPWVTFEYDYPHARVRLHFARVYRWRGAPHAREGQRLGFFAPGGELPQPLLPAAIPALRWLQLPEMLELPAGAWPDQAARVATRSELQAAAARGCEFALAGPLTSESDWRDFAALARDTPLPLYAYGALTAADLERARRAGAHGIARES
ncbi:MAG TPA: NUDIX domain-containing protein [Burkholderiaceae bacterium]|nr:NUDIX domain-containing protein [Burkholderiaceae bacterium]